MHHVLQLAHIAGPRIAEQRGLRIGRQCRLRQAERLAIQADEVLGQRQDVSGALAQRRQVDVRDAQAVIQVRAKALRLHRAAQVDVGRGQQAHIQRNRPARAHAHHLALLQHAQQLYLERRRQVADLVEEQRAAIGRLEPAGARLLGAGEGAGLVAEQLGIDQRLAESAAVHRDEGPLAAAHRVHVPRHQFLAGARLADDQHGGAGARHALHLAQQFLRRRLMKEQRFRGNGGQWRQ